MAKRALLLVLVLCFLLSGCAGFTYQNVNELLRAPALGSGYDEIQQALSAHLGGAEVQYKYPKEGEQRGPIVRADLNGDGREEAVLLYSVPEPSAGQEANFVHLAVMEHSESAGWTVVQDERGLNTEVAGIEVVDLLGDGRRQLIVGYAQATLNNKTLVLYQQGENSLGEVFRRDYSRYDIGDFTGEGKTGLVVISPADQVGGITLEHISTEGGQFVTSNQPVPLNANFTNCNNISPSIAADGRPILVVDGAMSDGNLFSQIVEYSPDAGFFTVDDAGALRNATVRPNPLLLSRDIDSDGMVEIPVFIGMLDAGDKWLDEVAWTDFSAPEPQERQYGVVDSERGVYFCLPTAWRGNLAITAGERKGEWRLQNKHSHQPLLSMQLVDVGEMPPLGSRRVLGATNTYLLLSAALTDAEEETIAMTLLI